MQSLRQSYEEGLHSQGSLIRAVMTLRMYLF
jgi:hypothetical protein